MNLCTCTRCGHAWTARYPEDWPAALEFAGCHECKNHEAKVIDLAEAAKRRDEREGQPFVARQIEPWPDDMPGFDNHPEAR